jgi:hypothetical protein
MAAEDSGEYIRPHRNGSGEELTQRTQRTPRGKREERYFDDQLDAAEELYGIQLHFNFNTNDVKMLIDSYRIAYSQEICDRCEALIRRQMLHYGYLVR